MSQRALVGRAEVIAMLAGFGQRSIDEIPEQIGSLELTWLITKVESQYGVALDLSDETLSQMTTVSSATAALARALADAEHV
jgi:acyl carrier protein